MKRLLVPSAALLWGFQFAFLNPALALLLVALFNATPAEVGGLTAAAWAPSVISPAMGTWIDRRDRHLCE